jgi:hypothetical protein
VTAPDSTLTISAGVLVVLLYRAYQFGKSQGKLRSDLNGLGTSLRKEQKEQKERMERLQMAVIVASKHDPETRRIAEILTGEKSGENR